jgi:hypothetical protein
MSCMLVLFSPAYFALFRMWKACLQPLWRVRCLLWYAWALLQQDTKMLSTTLQLAAAAVQDY